jgi:exonuclease SbcD
MKLLHLADIHLDRVFAGAAPAAARRRRDDLRAALERAFALGRERAVDAICIAGDVYEHDYVSAETCAFLRRAFADASVPLLVAPGNHDPYVPGCAWQRVDWPTNVHVFRRDEPEPFALGEEVVVWGLGFPGRRCGADALRRLRVPADRRTHLLLVHAALTGEQWADEPDYRPITRRDLRATGVRFAMLGHFHDGRGDDFLRYPGSPEPLGWGERRGGHGAAMVAVAAEGPPAVEFVPLATRRYAEEVVRVDGVESAGEIEARVRRVTEAAAAQGGICLLVRLRGEIGAACDVDPAGLAAQCGHGLVELVVRDETTPAYDLAALAREPSVRGRFVRRLLARSDDDADIARDAILAGLRALDGRREVLGAP